MRKIKFKCSGSFLFLSRCGLSVKSRCGTLHLHLADLVLVTRRRITPFPPSQANKKTDRTTTCSRRLNPSRFPDLSIYKNDFILVCASVSHHFIPSLLSTVSLVRPVEVTGRCGGGGTWQIVQGHGSPAQCWKPEPS